MGGFADACSVCADTHCLGEADWSLLESQRTLFNSKGAKTSLLSSCSKQ